MKQLVFFASGSGTNFQAVIDAIRAGSIDAKILGLITDKANIGAAERAKKNDIPVKIICPSHLRYASKLMSVLQSWKPDLIVLAGFMFKIPAEVIDAYSEEIINIHPSLLPKFGGKGFYGRKVHQAVLKAGETQSGCSVHIVTKEYDQGPVLAQRTVPVYPSDTSDSLAKRVLQQEHRLLPEAIKKYFSQT